METNREYVSDVDTDIDSDADYKAKKRASRTWKCQCAPADVPPASGFSASGFSAGIGSEANIGHDAKQHG